MTLLNGLVSPQTPYRVPVQFDILTQTMYALNDLEVRVKTNNAARLDDPKYKRLAVGNDWTLALQTAINENKAVDINVDCSIREVVLDGKESFWLGSSNKSTVQLLTNDGTNQQSAIRLINHCEDVVIQGIQFVGTGDVQPLYSDLEINCGIKIDDRSTFTIVKECRFTKFVSFGIWAKDMGFAPSVQGVNIINCHFTEWTVDLTAQNQAAILLGNGGEYSNILFNQFHRVPAAVRSFGGANCTIGFNMIWECNGGVASGPASDARGIIYCTPGFNNGKLILVGNHINHNDAIIWPILLIGDITKPQNPFTVIDNDVLANGTDTFCGAMKLVDAPDSLIRGNSFRAASPIATDTLLEIHGTSSAVIVSENDFRKGGKSIAVVAGGGAFANCAMNRYAQFLGTDKYSGVIKEDIGWSVDITGATGAVGFNELLASQTVARSATGTYVINHNFGDTNYSCNMIIDAGAAPTASWTATCHRQANTVTIYVRTGAGLADPVKVTVNLKRI